MSNVIELKGIHKSYGNLPVVKGVDMVIEEGKIISIIGKSGAGKSTLLHIMGTLDKPDKGEVIFESKNLLKYNTRQLSAFRNQKIGFVFQFHHLLAEFTAIENVCIPAYINGGDKKTAVDRATELLDFFGLKDRLEHKPSELSGGEQQRVAVARALMNSPKVIFADEPTGNLDTHNSREMHQLFQRLRDEFKQTFVIVTHNNELASLSDVCYKMEDGILVNQ